MNPENTKELEGFAAVPVISLIGRPNVGKSTLFNRLTRSKKALVTEIPGTTRDRKESMVHWEDFRFVLVDTGGMGFGLDQDFSREVEEQIGFAIQGSDYIWLMVDGKEGRNPFDEELYRLINKNRVPHLVLVNKVDNSQRSQEIHDFFALGCQQLMGISAHHGTGIDDALRLTAEALPAIVHPRRETPGAVRERQDVPTRIAFLGRPNVGKSSLVNQILGQARMIVSETAGTTREAVEIPFTQFGRDYQLVDTAGIRRKARTTEYLEKIGVLQSLGALNRVDVAVLVLDAGAEPSMQDARIARYIVEHERALVLLLNKWDLLAGSRSREKSLEAEVKRKLRFVEHAALVRTNALDGSGLKMLFKEVDKAAEQFHRRIQTADLNRVVQAAMLRFPPPGHGRSPGKILYGLQIGSGPHVFRFFVNHPYKITSAYTRFFENQLRYHFGFAGAPIRIQWRDKDQGKNGERKRRYAGKSNG